MSDSSLEGDYRLQIKAASDYSSASSGATIHIKEVQHGPRHALLEVSGSQGEEREVFE